MELQNRVAVITGGASGLGEATVRRFAKLGARIAIFDMNDGRGQVLAKELEGAVLYCKVDVASEVSVKAGIDAAMSQFGAIHLCCNFAGIAPAAKTLGREGPFPLDTFKQAIDVNLIGTFNVLRLCAEQMANNNRANAEEGRGVIINTASIAAYEGQMGQAAYSASKGGVVAMTLPVARDLATLGIRVNTIVPGLIHTPLFDSLPEDSIASLSATVLNPQRLGTPDEIAHLAQFIVENDYMNGECVRIDGGIRMQPR